MAAQVSGLVPPALVRILEQPYSGIGGLQLGLEEEGARFTATPFK